MIFLAAGMPRAGSGWHYNLTHDLVLTTGATPATEIRRRYHLSSILSEVNCNIGALTLRRLAMVLIPSLLGNRFTIKVHAHPTKSARWLIRRDRIRATYIFRDPRDALLSAYEYGQRGRQSGRQNAFSHLTSIEAAIQFMSEYVDGWAAWKQLPQVHLIQYERLRDHYRVEAEKLARFLGADPRQPEVQQVLDSYAPERARRGQAGLHFQKGVSGRFRSKMTSEQQQACLAAFGERLESMGYAPAKQGTNSPEKTSES